MRPARDPDPPPPDGQIDRLGRDLPPAPAAASYAPAVPRLRRGEPAAPPDRRARPRAGREPWRGRLVDRLC